MPVIIVLLAVAVAVLAGRAVSEGLRLEPAFIGASSVLAVLLAFFSAKSGLLLLVASMLLSPEIPVSAIAASGRDVVVRYDDVLLVVLFFSWLAKTAIIKDKPLLLSSEVQRPILLYTAVCILSTAFAILGAKVRWEISVFYVLKYVQYFLLYFMTFNLIESKEDARRYLKVGLVVAFLVTAYAIWYYLNAGPGARASTPFEAPLGNPEESEPASLGGYYLIVFGLLLGIISEMPVGHFAYAAVSMIAMVPAFILTLSRASYLGLAVSGVVAVFLSRGRRLFLIGAAAVGIISFSSISYLSSVAKKRVEFTYVGNYATNVFHTPLGEVRLEDSAAQRVRAWERSITFWLPKNVLIGNGVTGTGLVDAQIPLVIGETGLIGIFIWLWMIYVCFRVAWKLYRNTKDSFTRAIALGYIVGLAGLLTQSVGVNTFIIVRIMEPFWFLTAIIMRLQHLEENAPKPA